MAVGAPTYALGYAGMKDVELAVNERGEIVGDYNFRLHVSTGDIIVWFPDNLDKKTVPTPGPCFSFASKIPGGRSGGPIFDRERIYVHGVTSKGWEDQSGLLKFSFGSMLGPSMRIPIATMDGATLEELQASNDEGMPEVHAPDI